MRLAAGAWLIVVVLAALYMGVRLYDGVTFQTDLMALLPQERQDPVVQRAKDRAAALLGQRVVFLLGHKDRAAARRAGAIMAEALTGSGLADRVTYRLPADELRRLGTIFFPYRMGLLTAADRARLEAGQGAEIVDRALAMVYGPIGVADRRLLQQDPFLLLPTYLASMPSFLPRLAPDDGVLTLRDDGRTYVLVTAQLHGDVYAIDFQQRFIAAVDAAARQVQAAAPGTTVLRLGAVFYAAAGAHSALRESSVIAILSLAGTVVLILAVFRALRPLYLGFLCIGVGVLCAFAVSLWLFGTLHVVTLLFGTSLIGIAVDYCLQYLSARFNPDLLTPERRLRTVLPAIALGFATTMIGYGMLLFAPFPGLHQVAVFSAVGLVGAFATVVLWLPRLDSAAPLPCGRRMLAAADGLWSFWQARRYRAARWAFGVVVAAAAVGGAMRFSVDDDVRRLQPLAETLKHQEAEIRRLTGIGAGTAFLLVRADNGEQALEREEALLGPLDEARRDGALAGVQAVAQVVPSATRQRHDRALVQERLIAPFLRSYDERLGITAPPDLDEDKGVLTPAAIPTDSPLSFLRDLIVEDDAAGASHLVLLSGLARPGEVARIVDTVPGVQLIDPAGDITRLLGGYRQRALALVVASAILMLPLLAWRYGMRRSLRVALPPMLAVALAPPLVALAGGAFTFFNAMALVLVLSMGFDYAVFCRESEPSRRAVTMVGVWLAMVTTLLSFGLLAFSHTYAVHAFGLTLLVGTTLTVVLSPLAGDRSSP